MSLEGPLPLQRSAQAEPPAWEHESSPIPLGESFSVTLRTGGVRAVSPLLAPFRTDPFDPPGATFRGAKLFPMRLHAT